MSAAQKFMPKEHGIASNTALSGKFGVHAFNGTRTQFFANTNAAITSNTDVQTGTTETDSFDLLAPTTLSWEDIVRSKLDAGLAGEAYNLLMTKLDGRELDYVLEKLEDFKVEFEEHGFTGLANDLGNIIQLLSDSTLGLDYDYHASGPNAARADEDMRIRNKYPMERHFQDQRFKPPQFVQAYPGYK